MSNPEWPKKYMEIVPYEQPEIPEFTSTAEYLRWVLDHISQWRFILKQVAENTDNGDHIRSEGWLDLVNAPIEEVIEATSEEGTEALARRSQMSRYRMLYEFEEPVKRPNMFKDSAMIRIGHLQGDLFLPSGIDDQPINSLSFNTWVSNLHRARQEIKIQATLGDEDNKKSFEATYRVQDNTIKRVPTLAYHTAELTQSQEVTLVGVMNSIMPSIKDTLRPAPDPKLLE